MNSIVFEHTLPLVFIVVAFILAALWVVYSFVRYLPRKTFSIVLLALRLLFLLGLFGVVLIPGIRTITAEKIRPKAAVLLDTTESMALDVQGVGESRWNRAVQFLDAPGMRALRAKCQVDVYPFVTDVEDPVSIAEAQTLTPDGHATAIGASLTRLMERLRGENAAAVIVLTDGNDTRERSSSWLHRSWAHSLYVLDLGDGETLPDIEDFVPDVRVETVETQRRVVIGWDTILTATIAGQGLPGVTFPVQVLRNGVVHEEIPLQIPPEGDTRELQFSLPHTELGVEEWTVRIPPLEREEHVADNEMSVSVDVIDAQNRLLYLENTPRFESKYLNRELNLNRNITPAAFFLGSDGLWVSYGDRPSRALDIKAESLEENKIIILGDFDAEALDDAKCAALAEFVEKGGSLILLGGAELWGPRGIAATPLAKLLPFAWQGAAPIEGRFTAQWTAEGRSHPAFAQANLPETLPPVLTLFEGARPSGAALTLVESPRGDVGTVPLLISRAYGQGKVLAILTDSLWRWAMQPDADKPYARFWAQILEWMSPAEEDTSKYVLEIFTDIATLPIGEPVSLQARLVEPPDAPQRTFKIQCNVTAPSGRVLPLTFAQRVISGAGGKTSRGYSATFTPEESGSWVATGSVEIDGTLVESPSCFFSVRAVANETAAKTVNRTALRILAEASGGVCGNAAELSDTLAKLSIIERIERRSEFHSIWQQPLVLACLIGLLCIEWVVRKQGGLK